MCADICMCQDKRCPSRVLCYRYTAEPCKYRQAYWAKSPRKPHAMRCQDFWSNDGEPDPTDFTVSHKKNVCKSGKFPELCKCDAFAMPHKWNEVCQLYKIMHKPVRKRTRRNKR